MRSLPRSLPGSSFLGSVSFLVLAAGCGDGASSGAPAPGQSPQPPTEEPGPADPADPGGGGPSSGPSSSTTNILLLVADDLGIDMLTAYGVGSDLPATPNLDALASAGVVFRNAWSQPVCSPTRAGILTGRYGFRNGIGWVVSSTGLAVDASATTLPTVLDAASSGYEKACFGKWHLGNATSGGPLAPNEAGFDHFSGTLSSFVQPENYSSWTHVVDGSSFLETAYEPEEITDEAIAWMNARTQPFFCYLAFNLPHSPYHRPPDTLHSIDFTGVDPDPGVEPRPYYKAMIEALDTLLGRVMTQVDPGILDNTLILFLGDNGTPQGVVVPPFVPAHAKATTYEGGVRVPLIAAGPMVAVPGSECDALVQTLDLFATIAEVAGVDYQAAAPGVVFDAHSLVGYLEDPLQPSVRSTLYADFFYPNGEPPSLADYTCAERPPTPGLPHPAEIGAPQPIVCQPDIGYEGPGSMRVRVCGVPLALGAQAQLLLDGGPPGGTAILLAGDALHPMPFAGGQLVPSAASYFSSSLIPLDGAGRYQGWVEHIPGSEFVYYQAIALDVRQPMGFAISNAVKTRFFTHASAIRNVRYKLIYDAYTCDESFFDLDTDPFELMDLLETGMNAGEQSEYDALKAEMLALISS